MVFSVRNNLVKLNSSPITMGNPEYGSTINKPIWLKVCNGRMVRTLLTLALLNVLILLFMCSKKFEIV